MDGIFTYTTLLLRFIDKKNLNAIPNCTLYTFGGTSVFVHSMVERKTVVKWLFRALRLSYLFPTLKHKPQKEKQD